MTALAAARPGQRWIEIAWQYHLGVTVSAEQMARVKLTLHKVHGDWN
jgi:hypothetical protein